MKFCWTTILVHNMEKSLEFYQKVVGLEMSRRIKAGPGVEIAFLGSGETQVELIENEAVQEISVGTDISMGFEVDSLESMMEIIKEKGLDIHSGPFQPNPHTRFFYVLDPDGWKIQFVQHSI